MGNVSARLSIDYRILIQVNIINTTLQIFAPQALSCVFSPLQSFGSFGSLPIVNRVSDYHDAELIPVNVLGVQGAADLPIIYHNFRYRLKKHENVI